MGEGDGVRGEQRRRRLLWLGRHFRSGEFNNLFCRENKYEEHLCCAAPKVGHFSSPVGYIFGDFFPSTANAIVGVVAYLSLPTVAFFLPRSSLPPWHCVNMSLNGERGGAPPTHVTHPIPNTKYKQGHFILFLNNISSNT